MTFSGLIVEFIIEIKVTLIYLGKIKGRKKIK